MNFDTIAHLQPPPLSGFDVVDKIYIHPETGEEINLGPFLETIYWHDKREDMDFEVQKIIAFIDDLVGELMRQGGHDLEIYLHKYQSIHSFMKSLKDSLWLMKKENPKVNPTTAFRQMNWQAKIKDLQSRVKIMDEGYGYSRDKKKIRQLVCLLLDPLLGKGKKFKN